MWVLLAPIEILVFLTQLKTGNYYLFTSLTFAEILDLSVIRRKCGQTLGLGLEIEIDSDQKYLDI